MDLHRVPANTDPLLFTRKPVRFVRRKLRRGVGGLAPLPPGPKGKPVIGVLPEVRRDPFGYIQRLSREYGDVFHVPFPLYDVVVINHPDYVAQVMACRNDEYTIAGPATNLIARVFGATIPFMVGDAFKERRRLLTPMFSRRHLTAVSEAIVDEFTKSIDRWERYAESNAIVDLQHELAFVTMPAFMRAMLSIQITDAENEQLDRDLRTMMRMMSAGLLIGSLPRDAGGAVNRMRRWVSARVDQRLADPNPPDDLLQVLVQARHEDGSPISRRDLIMELTTLIGGGYETVVAAMSWTLALLQQNPQAQQRLYEEVDALGGQRPTFADLDRLTWARACFDEGQRLQGHPFHPRVAMKDDVIGGYRIERGTVVTVPMYTLQRDPRWWSPDPDRFDPNRFFDKEIAAERPALAAIPFGAGAHRCIGSAMAYMNGQFLLALIHQRYRLQTPQGWIPKHASTFSTTIEGGLPVTLHKVDASVGVDRQGTPA